MVTEGNIKETWQILSNYLWVSVDVVQDDSDKAKAPVVVQFTVTNNAPCSADFPEIVFENVELTVSLTTGTQTEKVQSLACGESFNYECTCKYGELMGMTYSINGTVSPKHFFKVHSEGNRIPGGNGLPTLALYLEVLDEIQIHKWIESPIKSMPIPGPDTTLAQLEQCKQDFRTAQREINEAGQQLQDSLRFVDDKHRQKVLEHKKLVVEYLNQIKKGCGSLQQMLTSPNAKQISAERDKIVERLGREASRVDEATQNLSQ